VDEKYPVALEYGVCCGRSVFVGNVLRAEGGISRRALEEEVNKFEQERCPDMEKYTQCNRRGKDS